ncbi:multiple sugar transport system permease protein [Rhodococcus sp. SMB37]|jgi:multiple sugar transport system permease protein|uniref:carbohydrate ABC transporter permease n=1 Tax=Rhodococcus sp. SMB37 TaxID=2512213 RepID=UPI000A495FB4|nr:carbohydrate ABC transporter permease [Rhodococcus sp. SMB37]TCN55904.1 multiple sugar transport system permease protein [Rhodococcus sp. SMB37]
MNTALRTGRWVLLTVALLISLFPFYWMLRTSVADHDQVFGTGFSLLPDGITFDGYARAWNDASLGNAMVVGLLVTFGILALQLLTCIPAAYVLTVHRARWTGKLFGFVMLCLLIPAQVTMIPLFIGLNQVGLGDTLAALILPFATSVLGTFMIRNQMMSIPAALFEACEMDGLGPIRTMISIVTPIAMPGIAAFSVYSIFVHWNDYMWPLLVARSPEIQTPPLALSIFQDASTGFDYPALAAGAAIVTVPIVVIFLVAQKHFVRGMSGTEITG